jgi:hypothetical protein
VSDFRIPLRGRRGVVKAWAVVDRADAHLAAHRWWINAGGHALARVDGRDQRMHRLVLGLRPGDSRLARHIDGDKLNNRRSNLVVA